MGHTYIVDVMPGGPCAQQQLPCCALSHPMELADLGEDKLIQSTVTHILECGQAQLQYPTFILGLPGTGSHLRRGVCNSANCENARKTGSVTLLMCAIGVKPSSMQHL